MAKSKQNKKLKPVVDNPVAKHMETFNKPKTFIDQKKEMKKGNGKYKGRYDASFDV